jgi:hypothetical protein
MLDELTVLKLVTTRLEAAGIPYMLTGSLASGHYGEPRMTRDVDVVVELVPADAVRLATLFGEEFDVDVETVRRAIERQSMFNLIHIGAVVKVDFIVRTDEPFRREEFARRRRVTIAGQPMTLVSPEDLILSKLMWAKRGGSELQRRDVRQLLRLISDLDWPYLDRWARALSVSVLLAELRG